MPALDGVRGIAIGTVLLAHFIGAYEPTTALGRWVFALVRSGWCGVDLFFVLSGFLITGILVDTMRAPNFFRAFYMRRLLRIFPLYYALLVIWFGVLASLAGRFGWDAAAIGRDRQLWYWAYLENWMLPGREPVGALNHLWSLAIEEQFYLVWPLVVWAVPTRLLPGVAGALVLGVPCLRWFLSTHGVPSDAIYEWTVTRVDSLALGGLLAVTLRSPRLHEVVARSWRLLLVLTGIGIVLVARAYGRVHFHDGAVVVYGFSLIALLSAALVAGAVLDEDWSWGQRVLRWSPLRALGRYSYALYVLHFPLFCIAQQRLLQSKWRTAMATPQGYAAFMFVGIVAVYAMARLSWTVFEAPLLQLKRYFVAPRVASPDELGDAHRPPGP